MSDPISTKIKLIWSRFNKKAFRDGFVASELSSNVAAQIATLREDRGWTQAELAERAGMAQPRISKLEDPSYETMSVTTLKKLASAFDVGLAIRFVPFSDNVAWSIDTGPAHLSVPSFAEDALPNRANKGTDWVSRMTVYTSDNRNVRPIKVEAATPAVDAVTVDLRERNAVA